MQIFEKYRAIKEDYLKRSPKKKWQFILEIGIFILKLCGVAVIDLSFKVTSCSFAPLVSVLDAAMSFIYTLWYYSCGIESLIAIPIFGMSFSATIMYVPSMITSSRIRLQKLVHFSGESIYTDITLESNPRYIQICDQSAVRLLKDVVKTVSIMFICLVLYSIFPLYSVFYKHEIILPFPVYFPFTDLDTMHLVINMANQLFVALLGVSGNIGIEVFTCMVKNTVYACASAICFSIDELTDSLTQSKPPRMIEVEFRNIYSAMNRTRKYSYLNHFFSYLLEVSDNLYWKTFIQPFTLTWSISAAIFFYLYANWMSGIPLTIFEYTQLYIVCDVGNEIEAANEMLILKFNELPWYNLPPKQQLAYAPALNRLQHGCVLQMGPLDELNFQTLSNMTKRIYSFYMMLTKFLE